MSDTKTIEQTMEELAEEIRKAPAEKQEEIGTFLRGYTAALENLLTRQEAS